MEWTFRTVVRAFLLVGGGYFLVTGLSSGETFEALFGATGVVLGAVGLAAEWRAARRESSNE